MDNTIQLLHRKHPVKVAQLYVKYGLPKAKLSIQTTKDLLTVFGDDFAYDLNKSTGFEGDAFFGMFKKKSSEGSAGAEGEGEKPKFMDKLKSFGKKAAGAYSAMQAQNAGAQMGGSEQPGGSKDEKIMGMNKNMFYAVVAVALILLVYVLTQKKQSA